MTSFATSLASPLPTIVFPASLRNSEMSRCPLRRRLSNRLRQVMAIGLSPSLLLSVERARHNKPLLRPSAWGDSGDHSTAPRTSFPFVIANHPTPLLWQLLPEADSNGNVTLSGSSSACPLLSDSSTFRLNDPECVRANDFSELGLHQYMPTRKGTRRSNGMLAREFEKALLKWDLYSDKFELGSRTVEYPISRASPGA
ncbi:hypothetical protein CC2G_013182 [Coprinopsis cinerea AmutBmut pab1-1]|nr:hypothetical protein CC2G_013182 [Coprinopsis cinerea AmutBmut pab1-1]